MITWEPFPPTCKPADWDLTLLESLDYNVFQSYGWGEYKRSAGWTPLRWMARNGGGRIVAMVQVLTKSFPAKVRIGWAPGGPILLFPSRSNRDASLSLKPLLERLETLGGRCCIRFDNYIPDNRELTSAFNQFFVRPIFNVNTGYSIHLNLTQPLSTLLEREASRHHRRYLKKALNENIGWRIGNDANSAQELAGLHNLMLQEKRLNSPSTNAQEITTLCQILGDHAIILSGYVNGKAATSCLAVTFGRRAIGMIAGTDHQGRQLSASYALFYRLFEHLQQRGITEFDFGGLNPRSNSAEGVNFFKSGFGGTLVERLGEWEWTNSAGLRWALNLALRYRGRRL